ncbi:hypothetical protein AWB99_23950 [Mycolicibacterium confluentis]|nr:hypothetical protein AWB99_23950 [Mycolicibacterium confluentis]
MTDEKPPYDFSHSLWAECPNRRHHVWRASDRPSAVPKPFCGFFLDHVIAGDHYRNVMAVDSGQDPGGLTQCLLVAAIRSADEQDDVRILCEQFVSIGSALKTCADDRGHPGAGAERGLPCCFNSQLTFQSHHGHAETAPSAGTGERLGEDLAGMATFDISLS